jgi:hypothetical protein
LTSRPMRGTGKGLKSISLTVNFKTFDTLSQFTEASHVKRMGVEPSKNPRCWELRRKAAPGNKSRSLRAGSDHPPSSNPLHKR